MAKPRDKGGDTKQGLLDVAIRLFAARGFAATSIRDIASAAGISASNIYHFFGSKEGLWLAIIEGTVTDLPRALREVVARDLDPVERFKLLIRTHIEFNNGNWREGRLFIIDEGRLSPEGNDLTRRIQREIFDIYVSQLVALRDQGYLSHSCRTGLQNLKIQALNVIGVVNWVVRWYQPRGPMSEDEISEELVAFGLRSVGIDDAGRAARRGADPNGRAQHIVVRR